MTAEPNLLWHTLPVHYLPYLLYTGTLLSATRIAAERHPLVPRPSAIRRKTKLGLADFVHLSPSANTPLLRDKQRKGYAHALLAFDRAATLRVPGVALLKYNTKRWAHRDEFVPITDAAEKEVVLEQYAQGKYPSLEILVPQRLPLAELATCLYVDSEMTMGQLRGLRDALPLCALPLAVSSLLTVAPDAVFSSYLAKCTKAGATLPPPLLPFD